MNDAIELFSENYVNGDCTFTVVSGDGTKAYLYDQKQATTWLSSGSDDTTTETITIVFNNWQGEEVSRTFDRIVLLNHNLAGITADYWNGSAWIAITEATTTLSDEDNIIEIVTAISATRFRINCTTAQSTDAEKYIGELKICADIVSLGLTLSDWQPMGEQKGETYRLAGGSLVSWKEWTKLAGTLSLENVSKTVKDTLVPYIKLNGFLTLIFYSDYDASEVYEVAIGNAPSVMVDRKSDFFRVPLELRER